MPKVILFMSNKMKSLKIFILVNLCIFALFGCAHFTERKHIIKVSKDFAVARGVDLKTYKAPDVTDYGDHYFVLFVGKDRVIGHWIAVSIDNNTLSCRFINGR